MQDEAVPLRPAPRAPLGLGALLAATRSRHLAAGPVTPGPGVPPPSGSLSEVLGEAAGEGTGEGLVPCVTCRRGPARAPGTTAQC